MGVNACKQVSYADLKARGCLSASRFPIAHELHMKVMAIASIIKPVSDEQRQQIMPKEAPATLKLYLDV